MEIKFNDEELAKVENLKRKYPNQQAALMGVLWLAQNKFGWISKDVMKYISELLDVPLSTVEGVVSFYTMYHKKQPGKYHVQVCTNVSCMLRGGQEIYEHISKKLNLNNNETSGDGKFSLEEVECMGACGGAPMIAINEDFYENLTIEKVDEILDSLK
ncbi:MAG: NAD(P)H-dependent oxidoreductase subunit E [Ignavibacteria bacterium]|nr:NAD(P)H-dependent oxidoreductase subunit E [Ignavibacteria bacterium]